MMIGDEDDDDDEDDDGFQINLHVKISPNVEM